MPGEIKSEFSAALLRYFKADAGGFSPVTQTEYGDSQITLSGAESALVGNFAKDWLKARRGSVSSLIAKSVNPSYTFRLHPTGEKVELNLVYPKPKKNELRLYLKAGSFKPQPNIYWCVFLRNNELWLGSFDFNLLATIDSLPFNLPCETLREEFLEPEIDDFQGQLNKPAKQIEQSISMLWGRDPKIARQAIEKANFRCEIFPTYPTFNSRVSLKPFMEAHHLIPMKLQHKYEVNLDNVRNVCSLSPYGHRLLHHGKFEDIEFHVAALAKQRVELLSELDMHVDDVLYLYQ